MTYPRVKIKSGIEVDTTNYLSTLEEAKNFFFQSKNYYVLPYIPKQKTIAGKTIFLPRLLDNQNIKDIDKVKRSIEGFKFKKVNVAKYQKYIDVTFKSFWKDLTGILGESCLANIAEIEIQVTNVGSGGKTLVENVDGKKKLCVRIRRDMLLEQIFSILIMGILKIIGYKEEYTWEERTAIREWFKDSTIMKKYFPHQFISMLSNLRENKQQGKYQIEAENYLKELGINTSININEEQIIINGHSFNMSQKEYSLFNALYKRKGSLVEYETIHKEVWGDNFDNFSLYAISKLVERIRRKLIKNSISGDLIQSYKGKGYYIGS